MSILTFFYKFDKLPYVACHGLPNLILNELTEGLKETKSMFTFLSDELTTKQVVRQIDAQIAQSRITPDCGTSFGF